MVGDRLRAPLWLGSALALGATISLAGGMQTAEAAANHAPPVTVRVILSHTKVTAGTSIKGTVLLTNGSSRRILVDTCAGDGWLEVGLKSPTYSPTFPRATVACAPSLYLKPGVNRYPATVLTTYESCLQQPEGRSLVSIPPCLDGKGLPPLPAGRYVTTVSIVGLDHLTKPLAPLHVTLLNPGR